MENFKQVTESNQSSIVVFWSVMLSRPKAASKKTCPEFGVREECVVSRLDEAVVISEEGSPQSR
jgi:hypothetical protein